VNWPYITAAVN